MTQSGIAMIRAGMMAVALTLVGSSAANAQQITITFSGQTTERENFQDQFASFEKANPGYSVQGRYSPLDQHPQLMQTQLQAGNAADVIQTGPGTGGIFAALNLAAGQQIADLSDEAWVKSLPEASKALVSLNGRVYGYPTDLSPFIMAYNPVILQKVGVSVPTTFGDLLHACGVIADAGYIPVTLAGASFSNVTILMQMLATNFVFGPNPGWNDARYHARTTFAKSPEWHTVVERFQQLMKARCFPEDVAGVQAPVHLQRFAAGKAAMYPMPSQAIGAVRAAGGNFRISAFPMPADDAANTKLMAASGIIAVLNVKSKRLDAAKKLLQFMSQPEQRVAYATKAGTVALGAGPGGSDVLFAALEPLLPYFESNRLITAHYFFWPNGGVVQQFATSMQGILTGQKTADDVLADTDRAWDRAAK
jgi:raffinose/stachyose/melibiose transport system substrate-binding protein